MRQRGNITLFAFIVILVAGVTVLMVNQGRATGSLAADLDFECGATGASPGIIVPVIGLNSNSSADNTTVIQNAINTAGLLGGGEVGLPPGTFTIDGHLIMRSNVELIGAGPTTVLKAGPGFLAAQGPSGGYPIITTYHANNVTIADLTADQSGNTLDGDVAGRLTGYVVEGRFSSNVLVDDVYVRNPFSYSIAMVRTTDFCVEHCNVNATATLSRYNQLDGIHILDSNSGEVLYNTVQSGDDGLVAHTIGAPVYNVLYADNDVIAGRATDGMQLAVGDFPIYDITVEDNDFRGSQYGIRTGYYDKRNGAVYSIDMSGNYIHSLTRDKSSPAIEIGGFGGQGPISHITAADTRTCAAGAIIVPAGNGNVVRGTIGCPGAQPA